MAADERMIAGSRQLLAVWDGSPSDGRDATAHLVAYARAHGVPVEHRVAAGRRTRGHSHRTTAGTRARSVWIGGHLSTTVGSRPAPTTSEARTLR
ncbi:hypothetical protein ACRAWF_35055 [Streptomyces sp. L7]